MTSLIHRTFGSKYSVRPSGYIFVGGMIRVNYVDEGRIEHLVCVENSPDGRTSVMRTAVWYDLLKFWIARRCHWDWVWPKS